MRPVVGMRAPRARILALALLAGLAVLLLPSTAWAADEPTIDHVEASADGIRVLVGVPAGSDVDLDAVTATLDGTDLDAGATLAQSDSRLERTTILAIDTSSSMRRNGRFEAAQDAALTFLDTVPDDVSVGIVTFSSDVTTALEPTTDRDDARAVVEDLELSRETRLYDGVLAAVDLAGNEGSRSVFVLSDGADTSDTSLDGVTQHVTETGTHVDVVALDQSGRALDALEELAEAGHGQVIESSGDALAENFEAQAAGLARQVLVTAPLPEGFDATEARVQVTLPTSGGDLVAEAFALIQGAPDGDAAGLADPEVSEGGFEAPGWLLYAGVAVFGVGLMTAALLLVPGKPQPMSIADRVSAYTRSTGSGDTPEQKAATEPVLDQAKAAAAGVLERNQGMEERLSARLAAAGSQLKPSEWLLLHVGIVIGAGFVGLVLGGGSVVIGGLFVLAGLVLPRLWLRWQAGRRRRAFNAALPETLQLMSGALSAGLSLAQATDTITREGPEPIASEFKRVLVENRIGVTLEDAFDGVAHRYDSRDFSWVVMAIRIQREVGGNLAEILKTVAATMREREYLRRQVKSLAAEGTLSAIVLSSLPPGFFLFVLITRREYIEPLFTEPLGIVMLVGATVWLAIGVFWMSRMVKVEV